MKLLPMVLVRLFVAAGFIGHLSRRASVSYHSSSLPSPRDFALQYLARRVLKQA
jgi:hypothetical protein